MASLWRALDDEGVPTLRPPGGHAVYVDAKALLPHVAASGYPGQALAVALYRSAACARWRSAASCSASTARFEPVAEPPRLAAA